MPAMLSIACPQCGRPVPLSLATPDRVTCGSCGFAGAAPPDVRQRLAAAGQILHSIHARERQLTGQQQRALGSSRGAAIGYWLTTAIVGVPLLACGALGSLWALGGKQTSFAGAAISLAPLVLFVLAAVLGQRWVQKRYAALRIACAAIPPAAPGQPAGCHVCGAPLAQGTTAIARCGHCAADNVVAPDALAAAAASRATAVSDFEGSVRREATLARTVAKQATFAILASAIGAPFFTVVMFLVVAAVLSQIEGPLDLTYRYGVVQTDAGNCVARVYPRTDGKWLLGWGSRPPAGKPSIEVRDTASDIPPLTANDLTGKRVRAGAGDRPPAGVIERVHGNWLAGNGAVIAGSTWPLEGLCLADP